MMPFEFGDILLVPFPFTSQSASTHIGPTIAIPFAQKPCNVVIRCAVIPTQTIQR